MKDKDVKIIYKTYKQFYGKEPNLDTGYIGHLTIEIQAMAYLLNEYGVSLGDNRFCYEYTDLNMPMSMDIQDIIIGKLSGNIDDLNDDSLEFSARADKLINIIGSAIRCITANSQNKTEELRKISNILYIKKHVRPLASDKEIMEVEKCTEEDLKKVEQLIEFIKQEQCKDNFDQSNIENVRKMIDAEMPTPYGMHVNESGNGKLPNITEESRKKLAKALIR